MNYYLNYPYFIAIAILVTGILIILRSDNLIKKVVGLNIFQTAIIIFYIAISRVNNGLIPIIDSHKGGNYVNPLPHVLMLTAIVVGVALTSVAFALVVKINQHYKSSSETAILEQINKPTSTKKDFNINA